MFRRSPRGTLRARFSEPEVTRQSSLSGPSETGDAPTAGHRSDIATCASITGNGHYTSALRGWASAT